MKHIYGSGGGSSSQSTGGQLKDDDPKLKSVSFAQIQFLLCEGEIEGPAYGNDIDGLERSVYLDNTPLSVNNKVQPKPKDLVISYGRSAPFQSGVPGYSRVATTLNVNKLVRKTLPVAQAVTADDPEGSYRARVLITHSALTKDNEKGQQNAFVEYIIRYTDNLGVVRKVVDRELRSRFSGQFQKAYEFPLEGSSPWVVEVVRVTDDDEVRNASSDAVFRTDFYFSSVVLLLDQQLSYPHSSVLSVGINADQYSSIPDVSIELKGRRIEIPSNYDPVNRTYVGTWDGTFVEAYSNNPAWVMRDLILNTRFGLGDYIESGLVDKWSLYGIAQYCDQLIPAATPAGTFEPRFTCNLLLQSPEDAWTVLQQLSSIFRGMLYYAAGSVVTVQDCAKDAIYTFSEANTIEEVSDDGTVSSGNFSYAGPAKRARHTAVITSWDDPANNYDPRTEIVYDEDGLRRYGYRSLDLRLLGVTSRGQALRAANWALLSEKLLDDTVSFRINEIGAAIRPGDVIKIADPTKAAARLGGRITAVTSPTEIVLDAAPTSPPGGWSGATFSFMVAEADGAPALRTRSITSISGDTVTLSNNSETPVTTFPWLIEVPGRTAQEFRVLGVEEQDKVFAITALRYRQDLYDKVDFNTPLDESESFLFKIQAPEPPTVTRARMTWDNGTVQLELEWQPPAINNILNGFDLQTASYELQYQAGQIQTDGSILWEDYWQNAETQYDTRELIPIKSYSPELSYKVRLLSVSRLGARSNWSDEVEVEDLITSNPLPDLAGFTISGDGTITQNATLLHFNQSSGTQLYTWKVNVPVPGFVNGVLLEARPSRTLVPPESDGLRDPDGDGWYEVIRAPLSDYYGFPFHAAINWDVRFSLTTIIPGLSGTSYKSTNISRGEIVPPTPINFRVVSEGDAQSRVGAKRFSWEVPSTEYDQFWPTGKVNDITRYNIRYRQGTVPDWENSIPLFSDGISGDQTWFSTSLFDYGEWCIMLRSQDITGWESDDFASVTVNIGSPIPTNVVESYDFALDQFPGTLTNFTRVTLGSNAFYPSPLSDPIYTSPTSNPIYGVLTGGRLDQINAASPSTYVTQVNHINDGAQLLLQTATTGTYRWFVRQLDSTGLMYAPPSTEPFYGTGDLTTTYVYLVDTPTGGAGWHPYAPNEVLPAGYYEFKLELHSLDGTTAGSVTEAVALLDYPDVIWTKEDVSISSSGSRITFPSGTFRSVKVVSLTVQDNSFAAGNAVNGIVTAKTSSYIDIQTFDATGAAVAGVVDVVVAGY
jgi:hypothetical protein